MIDPRQRLAAQRGKAAELHARLANARALVVSGLAGFRGAVSLAAALAVPSTVESGAPLPRP